ncbi:S8 family peptidase [Clostridium perfringens]|uniref:S8 family peptidase n=1 Tax=Clostridium TaxID=1485 RepID=UPI0013E3B52A|nr:S8 family peptidase [Clostridium perfringens]NGT05395.1 S8 family peptidase [Clostridium perfringens]WFE16428.1 S8 family peptidase [Clostridium perfringens]
MGDRKTIFFRGEEYNVLPEAKASGPRSDKRPEYSDAKENIINNINEINSNLEQLSNEFLMDDIIINMKMRIDRSSKSDHPYSFMRECNLNQVGTKKWSTTVKVKRNKKEKEETKIGKDIFISVTRENLNILLKKIECDKLDEKNKDVIRSIENLYLDKHENMLKTFDESWKKGRIEVVLHPIKNKENEIIEKFKEIVKKYSGDCNTLKIRKYENGPIFVSLVVDKEALVKIKEFNVIRSIQPLKFRSNTGLIDAENLGIKVKTHNIELSENNFIPDVKLGVFDGGVTSNHYIFDKYVIENDLTKAEKEDMSLNHGNSVASVALFGDIKELGNNIKLPTPTIKIESFRVFPLEDESDYIDLYEVIDHIEKVVKERPDIKVFNLSSGPEGPIEDDVISRFTYSIDRLCSDGKRIFVVAVGNSGEESDGIGRIQAPSDSVNCLGVGSYCCLEDAKEPASYSSYGDGREGAKIKPDVLEYGGDEESRIHFVGGNKGEKLYGYGTSFSAPIVARKFAEILGYTPIESVLTAKALIIHTAENKNNKPDKYLGNGYVLNSYEEMFECSNNKITITFEGNLLKAKRTIVNIPFIENLDFDGRVSIKWTLCTSTSVNPKDSDDYTDLCIEDTFIPNCNKFKFTHPLNGRTKTLDIIKDEEKVKNLLDEGWNQSKAPVTKGTGRYNYTSEQERRKNFKWDTVVKRFSGKMKYSEVKNPRIELHAISRDRVDIIEDRVKYSLIVTIEYIDCDEDVYAKTAKAYSRLEQSEIRSINEIKVGV